MVQPVHTSHACRFCRQKRSKCDGKEPCARCERWEQTCVYDDRTKETKDDLRKERDELQIRYRNASAIFQALQSDDRAGETMASLWNRTPLDQIASSLEGSRKRRDTGDFSGQGDMIEGSTDSKPKDDEDAASYDRDNFNILKQEGGLARKEQHPRTYDPAQAPWGLVGLDLDQVWDLLKLFFDWQYIPLFCVDREVLEKGFVEGNYETCSPALIRSILCLACRSVEGYDAGFSFYVNLGGRLLQEAKALLDDPKNDFKRMSDAQASGLLAIHQLGAFKKDEALKLVEECVRVLIRLHQEKSETELELSQVSWSSELSTSLHGAVALARIIRLLFQCLKSPPSLSGTEPLNLLVSTRGSNETVLEVLQTPTSVEPASDHDRFPALLVTLTSSVYCFLATINKPVTEYTTELLDVYHNCLSQYSGLIEALQSPSTSRSSMLFTHLVYHFLLLSLCRPFSHIPTHDAPVDFRAICLEAAQAILSLSASHFDLASNRQLPVFVPLFVHAAGLVSFELATSVRPRPPPSLLQHESSSSSSGTDQTESSGFSSANEETSPSTTMTTPSTTVATSPNNASPPTSFLAAPGSDTEGKRKADQINVSLMCTPVPTLAKPGVAEAMNFLGTMGSVFPMAREAQEHLRRLIMSSMPTAAGSRGYEPSFPWPEKP